MAMEDNTEIHEGDVSICFKCGEIMIFTKELEYRKPSYGEIEKIVRNCPEINRLHKWIIYQGGLNEIE